MCLLIKIEYSCCKAATTNQTLVECQLDPEQSCTGITVHNKTLKYPASCWKCEQNLVALLTTRTGDARRMLAEHHHEAAGVSGPDTEADAQAREMDHLADQLLLCLIADRVRAMNKFKRFVCAGNVCAAAAVTPLDYEKYVLLVVDVVDVALGFIYDMRGDARGAALPDAEGWLD
ncbi:hypothetical protein B0T26DRAFT_802917 [Lasiosphaeria miniovina]|uniref:Uncharacterized protein n=1 Tax=Lasiosphaeria miniovina TaxID=1954250 RepID=A0AA40ALI9_9PEZI|nr:uncharacterized protein B0T26DRAFT_802917 [Lasiosphaeria miniovina]KAK0717942.1 hypothetical protein B0T26DRAFT_802917 [Lasiosphaeria miniovina]